MVRGYCHYIIKLIPSLLACKQSGELMLYHLVLPGLLVPVPLFLSPLHKVALSACQRRQSDHSLHQAINVAWLKFTVLLLISKVMRQQCVIIEILTWCPPISHPVVRAAAWLQLNVPRKRDKTVINAMPLCLLSCYEKGHCHCPLACSRRLQKKRTNETRMEWKSIVTVGSIISLSFHALWLCVSCICMVNHLHFLYFVFSWSHTFSA